MNEKKIKIALVGNTNVGKSVIFNNLTGLHQHIGNWPGTTIELAEGRLKFRDYLIDIIDLPGIYSFSSFSSEEEITRDYIFKNNPDIVINVLDASTLERNLYLTLQLIEMRIPLLIALNQADLARSKGIYIDIDKLSKILGVPVVQTIAIKGEGFSELLDKAIYIYENDLKPQKKIEYRKELEDAIERICERLNEERYKGYPKRWLAIKILEGTEPKDVEIKGVDDIIQHLKDRVKDDLFTYISAERYFVVTKIVNEVQTILKTEESFIDRLDRFFTNYFTGSIFFIILFLSIFYCIFSFGDFVSAFLESILLNLFTTTSVLGLIYEGFVAGLTIVLPYIIPFYLLFGIIEDTGYIARAAFLSDGLMHKIGVHGKAIIPLIISFGCNVPGCLGCRIIEGEREREISIFLSTLVPCSAINIVIMSIVGKNLGIEYVFLLYVIILVIIAFFGKIAYKFAPGEPLGLIMEMPPLRRPSLKVIASQATYRTMNFVKIAFPIIILGSLVIGLLNTFGLTGTIADILSPLIEEWLLIPPLAGVVLIFGIVRKELTVTMLLTLFGTTNISAIMTAPQMLTFTLTTMLYAPCLATIAALVREIGIKKAIYIVLFETVFAFLIGGLFARFLLVIM
ncbi:ferrous iron transport protein B [Candidatus Methanoliparum sp. LAM-1]|uniref:ferrous iron transport protein B n=1 Tax=Candidatus Methanoliparum sp. LAM-1 TaxID=2874846 RepID=UPI001E4F7FF3|nr:ferrous iron transport protein B [Candidatus Methanoliparum sp. LAM-1]BDC35478.1 ferrous iron transporter B [Candidatus Methanoliparum sp. LAM-1]